jgi:hypothetical protein
MRMILSLVPVLLASIAPAVDDGWLTAESSSFVDIRLGFGTAPIPDAYPVDVAINPADGGGTARYTDYVDSNQAGTVSYGVVGGCLDPFGVVGGFEVVYAHAHLDLDRRTRDGADVALPGDASSLTYRTFGGNALLGVGLELGGGVHLEALGVLGLGAARLGFSDNPASGEIDGHGWYWTAGARGGLYYAWRRVVVGMFVECTRIEMHAEKYWIDAHTTTDTDSVGVGGRFEIGYHIP